MSYKPFKMKGSPIKRNFGVGTRAERGTLPTAQNEVYVTATVSPKYWYGRIEVSAQAMKQSQGDRAAFAEAMSEEMDRMTRNSRKYFNRYDIRFCLTKNKRIKSYIASTCCW